MRIARVGTPDGSVILGKVEDDKVTPLAAGDAGPGRDALRELLYDGWVAQEAASSGPSLAADECQLLAPVTGPQKILAIGLNYADHAAEANIDVPEAPIGFVKLPNSIIGPNEKIRYTEAMSQRVDYEAELAVILGRRVRNVSEDEALDAVFGYTICNDVSARDAQFADKQWVRGKSYDTFCPLGPWVVTPEELGDPQDLPVRARVNGEVLQDSNTSNMIFSVAFLISYYSRFMTFEPGDIIATGTPHGVGFVRQPPVYLLDGDWVEIEVGGIGKLGNPVAVEEGPTLS